MLSVARSQEGELSVVPDSNIISAVLLDLEQAAEF
tara:strand:- start:421 stop:525 length:105 start_codon:yes stop_codon:yes gene_type:complete